MGPLLITREEYFGRSNSGARSGALHAVPDDHTYLLIARFVQGQANAWGTPRKEFVVGLCCDISQADRLVYANPWEQWSLNACEVYTLPWSEWKIAPLRLPRTFLA